MASFLDLYANSEYTSWYVWTTSYGTYWTYDDTVLWPSDSSRTIRTSPRMSTRSPISSTACSTRATSKWQLYGFNPAWSSWESNTLDWASSRKNMDKEFYGIPIVAKIQQPQQQAPLFSNCSSADLPPQQGLPLFQAQTPGTAPVQALPVQPVSIPNPQNLAVPTTTETTPLSTLHSDPQAPIPEVTGMDLTALGDRLGAALDKKFENMAESLKLSLTSSTSSLLPSSLTPMMSRTDETHALAGETPSTGVTTLQQGDQQGSHPVEVPVKAKPPTPPDWGQQEQQPPLDQPSNNSQRSPLTREQRSSRRSRSRRRPTHHRRDLSPRTHRKETERRPMKPRSSLDK